MSGDRLRAVLKRWNDAARLRAVVVLVVALAGTVGYGLFLNHGTAKGDYRAREATAEEYAAWWPRAVEVWPDYDAYQAKTDRQIPIFLLEPAS